MILDDAATKVGFDGPMPMDCSCVHAGEESAKDDEQRWEDELNWMSIGENKGKSNGYGLQGQRHCSGQTGHRAAACRVSMRTFMRTASASYTFLIIPS